jgi:DNA adenine methylase
MKPVIKWVGGKHQLLDTIKEMLPPDFNPDSQMYYEPFLGGGAVLLELNPVQAIVSDINPELINMYEQIKSNVEDVISYLNTLDYWHDETKDKKAYYYRIREDFNVSLRCNTSSQAARFIYLNKHCFNGLYRVNKKGQFNVPFNGKLSGGSFDAEHLRAVSKQIQSVWFKCVDFEQTVHDTLPGDFVFIDSPYAPLTPTSFVDYTKEGFAYEDHLRLARVFKELSDSGIRCMLTNHDTELIRELYKDYNIRVVDVRRSINRDGNNRTGKEVIITNYEV